MNERNAQLEACISSSEFTCCSSSGKGQHAHVHRERDRDGGKRQTFRRRLHDDRRQRAVVASVLLTVVRDNRRRAITLARIDIDALQELP